MNWWNIIKNQIASTKGKQYQLDFSEPMIEEDDDDCRKDFLEIMDRINKADRTDRPLPSNSFRIEGLNRRQWEVEKDFPDFRSIFIEYSTIQRGDPEQIPEEVFCKALEMLKAASYNDRILTERFYNDGIRIVFKDLVFTRYAEGNAGTIEHHFEILIQDVRDALNNYASVLFSIRQTIEFTGVRTAERGKELLSLNEDLKQTIGGFL
tara:strand:+ start:4800 stop:5423 length:624 start_codon:yes stop_codon:yes gene_type:complete